MFGCFRRTVTVVFFFFLTLRDVGVNFKKFSASGVSGRTVAYGNMPFDEWLIFVCPVIG